MTDRARAQAQIGERGRAYLTRCLGINPFMWSAYESLSQLGMPHGRTRAPFAALGCAGNGTGFESWHDIAADKCEEVMEETRAAMQRME